MLILVAFLIATPLSVNIISQPCPIPMRALLALLYVAWLASVIWLEANYSFKPHLSHSGHPTERDPCSSMPDQLH
jgi:hypothetical protein